MNKFFLLVITLLLILAGCQYSGSPRVVYVTQQIFNTDLFKLKQECQKYTEQIEKKVKSEDDYIPETNTSILHYLDKIFYSPKTNSCLYIEHEADWVGIDLKFDSYRLKDALTGELLLTTLLNRENMEQYWKDKDKFEQNLKFYE